MVTTSVNTAITMCRVNQHSIYSNVYSVKKKTTLKNFTSLSGMKVLYHSLGIITCFVLDCIVNCIPQMKCLLLLTAVNLAYPASLSAGALTGVTVVCWQRLSAVVYFWWWMPLGLYGLSVKGHAHVSVPIPGDPGSSLVWSISFFLVILRHGPF